MATAPKDIGEWVDNSLETETPKHSYEKDFCIKIATILAPQYVSKDNIQRLLKQIAITKYDKSCLSLSLRLYNEVYINHIFHTQMKASFEAYKKQRDTQPHLKDSDRHRIEKFCIGVFKKIPPTQDLIVSVHNDFVNHLNQCDTTVLVKLIRVFFRSHYIAEAYVSAVLSMEAPEVISPSATQEQTEAIHLAAKHIAFVIDTIRNSLKEVFQKQNFDITSDKKNGKELQLFDHDLFNKKEINLGFRDYLLEIINDEIYTKVETKPQGNLSDPNIKSPLGDLESKQSAETTAQSDARFFKDQLIRIPQLIKALYTAIEKPPSNLPIPDSALPNVQSMMEQLIPKQGTQPPSEQTDRTLSYQQKIEIISIKFGKVSCKHYLLSSESPAAALRCFGLFGGVIITSGVKHSFKKFASLTEGAILRIGPYEVFIEAAVILLETASSSYELRHPGRKPIPILIFKSMHRSLLLLLYCTNAGIVVYRYYHNNVMNVSLDTFLSTIMSGPLTIAGASLVWWSIPSKNKACFAVNRCRRWTKNVIDTLFNTLYNSGIFIMGGIIFYDIPKNLFLQIVLPFFFGLPVALGQHSRYLLEKLSLMMLLTEFSMFGYATVYDSLPNSKDRQFEGDWQIDFRYIFLALSALYSSGVMWKNYKAFVRNYNNDESNITEIITRTVSRPFQRNRLESYPLEGNLIDGNNKFESENLLLDPNEYKSYVDAIENRANVTNPKTLLLLREHRMKQAEASDNDIEAGELQSSPKAGARWKCDKCVIL